MNWLTFWMKADKARDSALQELVKAEPPDISEPVVKMLELFKQDDKWLFTAKGLDTWEVKWIGSVEDSDQTFTISLWGQDCEEFVVDFVWATKDENLALTDALRTLYHKHEATGHKVKREQLTSLVNRLK